MINYPAVYVLASGSNGTLYLGVTSDLLARTTQHREHAAAGFARRDGVTQLVWYEFHDAMQSAIQREKQLKKWRRIWKIELIEHSNSYWRDLWQGIFG